MPSFALPGQTVNISVIASVAGFLDVWIDFNTDGDWADAGEHVFTGQALAAGANALSFTVPGTATSGQSYARFRFRTTNAPINYDGLVANGEVEDYALYIEQGQQPQIDFGDLPDNPLNPNDYPTLLASNGARHTIANNTYLGLTVDGEPDGQPGVAANGDNINNLNDEDGVTFLWGMSPGNPCKIKVVASVPNAFLNMWIDFNANNSFADPGEHVFTDIIPVAGNNYYTFMVPGTAVIGPTYTRFRFSNQTGLSYSGAANDGEVEDYRVSIKKTSHKWHQLPDDILPGLHSDANVEVADDWVCNGGLVTEFDWWGNYELQGGVENRGDGISQFIVTAYSDANCTPESQVLTYAVPFTPDQELSTGTMNIEGSPIYRYTFILPVPFPQEITHTYWFSVKAISVNGQAPAQWRWQEANRWSTPVHCPTLSGNSASGWQPVITGNPIQGNYSDMAFSVINTQAKTLNLKVYLEGLYAGDGVLNKAQDEYGDHYAGTTADKVMVELHNSSNYQVIEHTFNDVSLSTNGDVSISPVPEALHNSYYVTVKHRNSIETTSAVPVSFSESDVSYDFTTSSSSAFGYNLKSMEGRFAIYGGDENQDGLVDSSDMIDIDNDVANFIAGYVVTDVNGDGLVDSSDMILVDNNSSAFIGSILP
jgi:hypothetical protein